MTTIDQIAAEIAPCRSSTLGPKAIRKAAVARGCVGHDLEAVVARAIAIKDLRQQRGWHLRADPLEQARTFRPFRLRALKERRAEERRVEALLRSPMAGAWTAPRRAAIAASGDLDAAIAATLEAVARLARTKWGWTVRHRSTDRAGRRGSTYVIIPNIGEVRVSDHEIPVYGERAERYEKKGPRWTEILVRRDQIGWSPTKWRRMLILTAAGRV